MTHHKPYYYDMGADVTAFNTTRHGGYSTSRYAEFNINRYCGDNEEHIRKNRKALCSLLGISDDRLLMPHQVHLTNTSRHKSDQASISTVLRWATRSMRLSPKRVST
jgi:copper oxidase (laccase) domain-containing protein